MLHFLCNPISNISNTVCPRQSKIIRNIDGLNYKFSFNNRKKYFSCPDVEDYHHQHTSGVKMEFYIHFVLILWWGETKSLWNCNPQWSTEGRNSCCWSKWRLDLRVTISWMIAYLCLLLDTIICLIAIICSILVVLWFFASSTPQPPWR